MIDLSCPKQAARQPTTFFFALEAAHDVLNTITRCQCASKTRLDDTAKTSFRKSLDSTHQKVLVCFLSLINTRGRHQQHGRPDKPLSYYGISFCRPSSCLLEFSCQLTLTISASLVDISYQSHELAHHPAWLVCCLETHGAEKSIR